MDRQESPETVSTDISTDNKGDTASYYQDFNTILDDFQQGKSDSLHGVI